MHAPTTPHAWLSSINATTAHPQHALVKLAVAYQILTAMIDIIAITALIYAYSILPSPTILARVIQSAHLPAINAIIALNMDIAPGNSTAVSLIQIAGIGITVIWTLIHASLIVAILILSVLQMSPV